MLSHLMVKKEDQIFINAAGGDCQEIVVRRAARVALREARAVNYQAINKEDYKSLDVVEAKKIMTPRAWIEEARDDLSDRLSRKEIESLTSSTKKRIIAELKKQRAESHRECLAKDKEIKKITKSFNV